ncbi:MAG: Gfo/Idh/MocA family oxidoreductase, partial [Oscillospiraceae bacterium]|nr:Gfo/Idh/MocA family oxidoreductase [Oscillospiraceae bacterium]
MTTPVTFAICGCGSRGLEAYAPFQELHPERMRIAAGADSRPERLAMLRERYGLAEDRCFASDEELLAQPRLADAMIIATQDRQHVPAALAALDKGYHLLLEKPISPDLDQCRQLVEKARETGRMVVVCHVLRYTKFYGTLEAMLRRGEIGKIETIDAVENVAYWHQAHSFVRGNWRRSDETSPMILAKSCHDMDILRWLAGERCLKVQSFGSLDYFRPDRAPAGAAERCLDGCACKAACPYDAEKIYLTAPHSGLRTKGPGWPCNVLCDEPTEERIYEALRTGPYGRCVFHCDNDVVDHQTVNLEFANNIHATFTMTAFT